MYIYIYQQLDVRNKNRDLLPGRPSSTTMSSTWHSGAREIPSGGSLVGFFHGSSKTIKMDELGIPPKFKGNLHILT